MAKKEKDKIDIKGLKVKETLEEAVACSILGRAIASYGAILTSREKKDAELVYYLLKARRKILEDWPVTAQIYKEKKVKKLSPSETIKKYIEKYPDRAADIIRIREGKSSKTETSVLYGLNENKNLSDEGYINTLKTFLKIPDNEAAVLYHGILKPAMEREEEKKGLTGLVIK